MGYTIVELKAGERDGFAPRGAAKSLWSCRDPEVMISGPAETGKTWSALQKLNALAWKYPNAQLAMIRKTQSSLQSSVVVTFRRIIGTDSPVKPYGGQTPVWYDYPNGARIWLGGMDNPDKVLSSERDFIYVNQAEELTIKDWETLRTRNTGRGGVAPYAQQFGDCNPGPPTHWIKDRERSGKLRLFESRHEDNPTLFDDDGKITAQGVKSLAVLDGLTGVRYYRLRKGLWVAAEGVIYENWDTSVHHLHRHEIAPIGNSWPRIWGVDFGYTHPFVWQQWIIDPDGRLILDREIYRTRKLVEDHARSILDVTKNDPKPQYLICDHDAEDRATLERHLGIKTTAAYKGVSDGIQAVQTRLKVAGDGKPRIIILRDALVDEDKDLKENRKPTCTAEEFEVYTWQMTPGQELKDVPLKENDHGMDNMRYVVAHVDKVSPTKKQFFVL